MEEDSEKLDESSSYLFITLDLGFKIILCLYQLLHDRSNAHICIADFCFDFFPVADQYNM